MPRAVTSWETIRRLFAQPPPSARLPKLRALQSAWRGCRDAGYHREQQQGYEGLKGGDLVRLSLRAID
jgi:hypothetical protein